MTRGRSVLTMPPEVLKLADSLAAIHGDVLIATEEHGIHLYMASPFLLSTVGEKELGDRHLAVNASKYFGYGEYSKLKPAKRELVGLCMKSKTKYKVCDLDRMQPLANRGIRGVKGQVIDNSKDRYEIDDGNGNKIPDHPGEVIPIDQLPLDHPAVVYLHARGVTNFPLLVKMFGLAYCWKEAPESRACNRYYRKSHAGWKDTPQGRIVFHGYINGVRRFWQARYLDLVVENTRYVFHPYDNVWMPEAYRSNPEAPWVLHPPFDAPYLNGAGKEVRWNPHKYVNATDSQRAVWGIFGYDAAVARQPVRAKRFAILTEGPLDAGSFGPPGIAGAGSYLSTEQAHLIAAEFPVVFLAYDTDKAGINGRDVARKALGLENVELIDIEPDPGKDFGAMTRNACWSKIMPHMARFL